jgi:hypothetical protein
MRLTPARPGQLHLEEQAPARSPEGPPPEHLAVDTRSMGCAHGDARGVIRAQIHDASARGGPVAAAPPVSVSSRIPLHPGTEGEAFQRVGDLRAGGSSPSTFSAKLMPRLITAGMTERWLSPAKITLTAR